MLRADELARLFEGAGSVRTETMLRAAGEAGLRRGQIAGLRWGDVNLAARRLTVERQVVQERLSGKPEARHVKRVTGPKSGRARAVAITPAMAERLADWYAESVVEGGAPADGYVWQGDDDGPMHDRSLARALERACRRAGLPHTSPHQLRYSAASVALGPRSPDCRRRPARARLAEHHRDHLRPPRRRLRPRPRRRRIHARRRPTPRKSPPEIHSIEGHTGSTSGISE